jgi:hypothetical protein
MITTVTAMIETPINANVGMSIGSCSGFVVGGFVVGGFVVGGFVVGGFVVGGFVVGGFVVFMI